MVPHPVNQSEMSNNLINQSERAFTCPPQVQAHCPHLWHHQMFSCRCSRDSAAHHSWWLTHWTWTDMNHLPDHNTRMTNLWFYHCTSDPHYSYLLQMRWSCCTRIWLVTDWSLIGEDDSPGWPGEHCDKSQRQCPDYSHTCSTGRYHQCRGQCQLH